MKERLRALLPGPIWAGLRALRYAPDRLLHPLRRRRARRLLRRARPVSRVLFVCYGNICRSPYAAVALGRELSVAHRSAGPEPARGGPASEPGEDGRASERPGVASVGLFGPGRPSPPAARAVAARRGMDLSAHRSRLLEPDEPRPGDLVVVMESWQAERLRRRPGEGDGDGAPILLLGDLDDRPIAHRRIRDPVDQPEAVFEEVYGRIDRCVRALARELGAGRG